jgi:hypothetical protein
MLGQDEDAGGRTVLGADRLCRAEALVGVGGWHPNVDDRHIREVLACRPQQRVGIADLGDDLESREGAGRRLRAPGSNHQRGRASGSWSIDQRRIAAPEMRSLGMKPRDPGS